MNTRYFLSLLLISFLTNLNFARGDVVIECREIGSDVVCTGSGTLNVSTLGLFSTAQTAGGLTHPVFGSLLVGSQPGSPADYYRLPAGVHMGPIGTGGLAAPDLGSPIHWGIGGSTGAGRDHVMVPTGYVSGDLLPVTTSTYLNDSFSTLGLETGEYRVAWGNGANADSLTIRVISSVPEPSAALLALFGIGAAGLRRFRRL
jgi:hypothetical protein